MKTCMFIFTYISQTKLFFSFYSSLLVMRLDDGKYQKKIKERQNIREFKSILWFTQEMKYGEYKIQWILFNLKIYIF